MKLRPLKIKASFLLVMVVCSSIAQNADYFTNSDLHLGLSSGAGILTYYGPLNNRAVPFSSDNTPSFRFLVLGQYKSLSTDMHYDALFFGQSSNKIATPENFKVFANAFGLLVGYNPFYTKRIGLKLAAGLDWMSCSLSEDILDNRGQPYYYWNDGTIRNEPQSVNTAFTSSIVSRDYQFQTKEGNYRFSVFTMMAELPFRLTKNVFISFYSMLYIPIGPITENYVAGGPSVLLLNGFSVAFRFYKQDKPVENSLYSAIDFKKLETEDADGDDVPDMKDLCPGTPKGAKVDRRGCLIDSDQDGIPDIYDKEPHSGKGLLIDLNGVGHKPSSERESPGNILESETDGDE